MAILAIFRFRVNKGNFQKRPIWRCYKPLIALKGAKSASKPQKTHHTQFLRNLKKSPFFDFLSQIKVQAHTFGPWAYQHFCHKKSKKRLFFQIS